MKDLEKFKTDLPNKGIKSNVHLNALRYCIVNVFGSFLSIAIAPFVIVHKLSNWPALYDLVKNGEAVIICISLLLSCIYTLYTIKGRRFWYHFVFWLSLMAIVFSIVIYVLTVENQYDINSKDNLNWISVIKFSSIALFIWSLISVYTSQVLDYLKDNPDFNRRNKEFGQLQSEFKTLQ